MELFKQLGEQIEALWLATDYNEEALPDIAAAALKEARLPERISAWDVLKWTIEQNVLPEQKDPRASFGDPPITLYASPRFHIDVYFWFEGTTATHQHGFCGAFQVLHGSSIHSWYEWEQRESVNTFTQVGKMDLKVCELLEVGDIQRIWAGKNYIHALFHLDQPSATIVVRTDKSPMYLPQYSYHKPSLATDPFFEQITVTKKLQSAAALIRANHPDADAELLKLVENSDFQTTYMLLAQVHHMLRSSGLAGVFGLTQGDDRFKALLDAAGARHPKYSDVLPNVFAHREKQDEIVKLRATVTNPEHRYFLALLLNAENREQIFSLIKKRFPETDPLDKVLDWVMEMSQTRIFGATPTNALGIPDFDNFDLLILEKLLEDKTEAEIADLVKAETPGERATQLLETLGARIAKISGAVIFQPLLREN